MSSPNKSSHSPSLSPLAGSSVDSSHSKSSLSNFRAPNKGSSKASRRAKPAATGVLADDTTHSDTEEVTDAMGYVHEESRPHSRPVMTSSASFVAPLYDHRAQTGMGPRSSSDSPSETSSRFQQPASPTVFVQPAPQVHIPRSRANKDRERKSSLAGTPRNYGSSGSTVPPVGNGNGNGNGIVHTGTSASSNADYSLASSNTPLLPRHSMSGAASASATTKYRQKSLPTSQLSTGNVYKPDSQFSPQYTDSYTGSSPGNSRRFRRRAFSDVEFVPPHPIEDTESLAGYSPFDPEVSDDAASSSVYISSNPTSRRGSESSIDDVCFPVTSLDDSGHRRNWPDISVLQEFATEEAEEIKKINEASAVLSSQSSLEEDQSQSSGGVNFEHPIVSRVDKGDSVTEPLIQSKEEETNPINGRLRPPRITPWDSQRHDSFRARQTMLGKFRFTYFREDMTDTIHSPNISGLIHNDSYTFADLFSPSYYGPKIQQQQQAAAGSGTLPNSADTSDHNSTRDATPQLLQANSSRLNRTITSSSTPATSVVDYSHIEKVDVPPFWLDVYNPTEDEMKCISKAFGIHPLTTEDIFLGEAREKVELFKDYYFVCFSAFDVAQEHLRQKQIEKQQQLSAIEEDEFKSRREEGWLQRLKDQIRLRQRRRTLSDRASSLSSMSMKKSLASISSKRNKLRSEELAPLNMYIVVFRDGVITFHFRPTPHPANVRRRARLLRDYLTVTSDWIGYALIDDITDAFAPLNDSIEREVNSIEDEILKMQSGECSDDESDDESFVREEDRVWVQLRKHTSRVNAEERSISTYTSTTSSSSSGTRMIGWKRKGDMLARIADCRRRVMSLLRLLGSKPDVIKGFAKRCNEQWEVAPKSEIGLYLGDIQDHVVTMVQSLNHYEKVLARSHSNYLAQINIDMTKVNNDMNDILGKITILGTVVMPLNIVTGLWGMNCLVPGEDVQSLTWFWSIVAGMACFSITCYVYAKRISGLV